MAGCAAFSGHFMTMISIDSLVVDIVAFQALRVIAPIYIEEFMGIWIRTRSVLLKINRVTLCAVWF